MTAPGKDNAGGMPTPPYAWACDPNSGKACPRQQRRGHATPEEATQRKRRALLAAAVRWPLAGGLALLAARLLARSAGGPLDPDEKCVNRGLCRGCRALGACRSPQAELFRQAAGGTAGLPGRGDGGQHSARPDKPAVPQPSRSTERESANGDS